MKLSVLSLPRSFTALALLASGLSFVQNASAASAPAGPVVIPGGAVTTTYIISAPGSYVLGGNRTLNDMTKHAIEIKAPDVTLDLGGFTLAHGTIGPAATGALVYIPATENVEIRNGTLADAASHGIRALAGKGLRVIGVRIVSAKNFGIETTQVLAALIDKCHVADTQEGINTAGPGTLVRDCVFSACSVRGATIAYGSRIVSSVAYQCRIGFYLYAGCTASDCTVISSTVQGILAAGATLRNVDLTSNTVGVFCTTGVPTVIVGSRITHNTTANVDGTYIIGPGNVIQ